jgi:hypothetical protein
LVALRSLRAVFDKPVFVGVTHGAERNARTGLGTTLAMRQSGGAWLVGVVGRRPETQRVYASWRQLRRSAYDDDGRTQRSRTLERASVTTWIALGGALVALDVVVLVAYLTRGAASY